MALLDVDRLTMRFGGLTAVSKVDLQVGSGQIVSIIGPNGAGKTTVFNAITGIYEPTEGTIKLEGRIEGLPVTPWRIASWVLIGLATGLAFLLFSVNIDGLWKAAIKRNMDDPDKFTYAKAWQDGLAYMRGELALAKQANAAWKVVSPDGRKNFGLFSTQELAQARKNAVEALGALTTPNIKAENGKWIIHSADDQTILGSYESRAEGEADWQGARAVFEAKGVRQRTQFFAFFAGLVLGFLSGYSIFKRTRRTPEIIALGGIARTFQNIRLFQNMTVEENVLVAMDRSFPGGLAGLAACALGLKHRERIAQGKAHELLAFVGLNDQSSMLAKNLPYGDQRRLEIARALATQPKLLLLDEPAAGMNPSESASLMKLIGRIRDQGFTILLIEHHMDIVMAISDQVAVLDHGVKIASGTAAQVRANPAVIEAYLGKEEVH